MSSTERAAARPRTPSAAELHLTTRFTYGWTPALGAAVARAGGLAAWFSGQLDPARIPDRDAESAAGWWPRLAQDVDTLWNTPGGYFGAPSVTLMDDFENAVLAGRVLSERQVLETMTEFWEHSLHVPVDYTQTTSLFRADYHRTVRAHALGRFADLLSATVTHPAMGLYLGNAISTRSAPNENLGRELLELHTLGVGNYTEDDVKGSARILTGWRVYRNSTIGRWVWDYDPVAHWVGPVRVCGFEEPNDDADGRELTHRYLDYLAHHPATAHRIARRLALRFVSDEPSAALVDLLARTYLDHDTAIVPVLQALAGSAEFRAGAGRKVRTPTDEVAATLRALGARFVGAPDGRSSADLLGWMVNTLGGTVLGWRRPDGEPLESDAWTSVARVLGSFRMHWDLPAGKWTGSGVLPRAHTWIPHDGVRFDRLVDHVSRRVLGRAATPRLVRACCQVSRMRAADRVHWTRSQAAARVPLILGTVLDSPDHLAR